MAYRCSVKNHGTVLYRYGGDLKDALYVTLGLVRSLSQKIIAEEQFQHNMSETCLSLNAKFHESIKKN